MEALRRLQLSNIRGIVHGKLEGFGALTILTGPNGCGKSTILDALSIGAAGEPLEALGKAVRRRKNVRNTARWFIHGSSPSVKTGGIDIVLANDLAVTTGLAYASHEGVLPSETHLKSVPPYSAMVLAPDLDSLAKGKGDVNAENGEHGLILFNGLGDYWVSTRFTRDKKLGLDPVVRLIDPAVQLPLEAAYSEAFRQGRKPEFLRLLADLDPRIQGCDLLSEADGTPAVYLTLTDAVIPIGLAGDGVQTLAQIALDLASSPGGLVLVEEPEVCLHPRAILQAARAMLAAMRRGIQLVITTHSLELIDAVIATASDADIEQVVLFNLALEAGNLKSSRYSGKDVAYNREVIANDLR